MSDLAIISNRDLEELAAPLPPGLRVTMSPCSQQCGGMARGGRICQACAQKEIDRRKATKFRLI